MTRTFTNPDNDETTTVGRDQFGRWQASRVDGQGREVAACGGHATEEAAVRTLAWTPSATFKNANPPTQRTETTGQTKYELLREESDKIEASLLKLDFSREYCEMVLANMSETFWAENEYDGPNEDEDQGGHSERDNPSNGWG